MILLIRFCMMHEKIKIAPHYIIDESGKKTGVILDIKTFEKLIEDIEDIYFTALAQTRLEQEQEYIDHEDVKHDLFDK